MTVLTVTLVYQKPYLTNNRVSKDTTIRQGKETSEETDLSHPRTTSKKPDTDNRKGPTTEEVEMETYIFRLSRSLDVQCRED